MMVQFRLPLGFAKLQAGTYPNAVQLGNATRADAFLMVYSPLTGDSCRATPLTFTIDEIQYVGIDVASVAGRFEVRCQPSSPVLHGAYRYERAT
jgi:hypothetical protein